MNPNNLFYSYLKQPHAKTLERIAFESGAGSVEFLRQIGRGERVAAPRLARGIELATGGLVTCRALRPGDYEDIWGTPFAVYERMRLAEVDPASWRSMAKKESEMDCK